MNQVPVLLPCTIIRRSAGHVGKMEGSSSAVRDSGEGSQVLTSGDLRFKQRSQILSYFIEGLYRLRPERFKRTWLNQSGMQRQGDTSAAWKRWGADEG